MKIMEVKVVHRDGCKYYEPIRGFALFKHCANGRTSVNGHFFKNTVKPLLLIHGIKEVNIV